MPAKWQRWMPFHIDKFRGSPSVQAMHPTARAGYLYLLASAWQSDDCTISADPIDLADESGLGDDLWAVHGPRILRKFEAVSESGRLRNAFLFREWTEAKRVYDARKGSARNTNDKKPHRHGDRTVTEGVGDGDRENGNPVQTSGETPRKTVTDEKVDGDRHGDRGKSGRSPSRSANTYTETGTETKANTNTPPNARAKVVTLSTGSQGEFAAAFWLQQEIGMPATPGDMHVLAQAIQFCARDAGVDTLQAAEQLKLWANEASERGDVVNIFWFKDRKFMKPQGAANAAGNRSQQRTNGNLAALAEAKARRDRKDAGSVGGSETGIDQRGDLRGLLLAPGGLPN